MKQDDIYDAIGKVHREGQAENHRYRSWQHCYLFFATEKAKQRPDLDLASLHLGFYLASWGMYRGSSFLLQKDYLVHKDAVRCLLSQKNLPLYEPDDRIMDEDKSLAEDILALATELRQLYHQHYQNTAGRDGKTKEDLSATLLTKVLMGAMGCSPAYDEFVRTALASNGLTQRFGLRSLRQVMAFVVEHKDAFHRAQADFRFDNHRFPLMKLADMYFWQKGFEAGRKYRKKPAGK